MNVRINNMAYYSSPKQYENAIGKRFSENRPCIQELAASVAW